MRELVEGNTVLLEKDVRETDRYGRLLRYVYVQDDQGHELHVNWELVFRGYANSSSYPPDVKYQDDFRAVEQEARNAERGFWSPATCSGGRTAVVPTTPPVVQPAAPAQQPAGNCHPSYPDVCIPPSPPDLNCPDVPYKRFRVLPPDPHGFDRDKDGIGCER
jgi:micrococcal nuclease